MRDEIVKFARVLDKLSRVAGTYSYSYSLKANLRPKNFCLGLIRPKVSFYGCLGRILSVLFVLSVFLNLGFWLSKILNSGQLIPDLQQFIHARDTRQLDSLLHNNWHRNVHLDSVFQSVK